MKRQTTKRAIGESFLELAQSQPIEKITITEITDNCNLTQPTFYNHFRDKFDLIKWLYTQRAHQFLVKIGKDGYTWQDSLSDTIREINNYKTITVKAIKNEKGITVYQDKIVSENINFFTKEIQKRLGKRELSEELTNLIKVYCYGATYFVFEWLQQSEPLKEDKVIKILEESMPDKLKEILV